MELPADARVKKRPGTHQIADTPELSRLGIPQRECVIAKQLRQALFAPATPHAQDKLFVGYVNRKLFAMLLKLEAEIVAAIQPHIAQQPNISVQRTRLRWTLRSGSRPQKGKAKAGAQLLP